MSHDRKRIFVDPPVQKTLMTRCLMYWVFCVFTTAMVLLCWSVITDPGRPTLSYLVDLWVQYRVVFGISLFLMALAIYDFVRVSNRFCGPMMRLKNEMNKLSAGEKVDPINFRKGDFWKDIADSFNQLSERVQNDSPTESV